MKNIYVNVEPEMMELERTLKELGLSRRQLIWIGILIGTDFNEGVDGVGPKTALKIAKASGSIKDVEDYVTNRLKKSFELDIREVEELFEKPEVREIEAAEMAKLARLRCDADGVVRFMCDTHGFSSERVSKALQRIGAGEISTKQSGIDGWL
jgi:flap endonuclease-1